MDTEYELPIAANISAGNVHDSQRASNLLREGREITSKFRPDFVMADKGYSGEPLARAIKRQYHAEPIIDVNPSHKRWARKKGEALATPAWKALYRQRPAVERVFSRLKGQRSLNHITVRMLAKVTVHCYLALIALQIGAFLLGKQLV